MSLQLSKSDYMMFLKHPAWLWLNKHDKDKIPPIDDNLQSIFNAGHTFEPYAEALFPNAVKIEKADGPEMIAKTEDAWNSGMKVVLQGRVEFEDLLVIYDVLERVGEDRFDLYEIKASTKEKADHILDLAFQKYVLEKAGFRINQISVLVANNEYVRKGEVEPEKLVKKIDVTDKVSEVFPDVENNVSKALAIMKSSTRPDISPRHAEQRHMKDWLKIFLNLHLDSDPYSIYRLSGPKRDLLGELEDQGYELMKDVPNDFEGLHKKHQRQIELMRIGDPVIQKEKIREFLEPIKYPLYFLDYETTAGVVPLVDGMRPWQQLPIQYSIHVQNEPGAELIHKEFIHTEKSNPSEKLIDQLQQDIGTDGTILVWYEPFEKGRNIELGLVLPEQMDFVKEVNERVVDLMIPFKKGWYEDYRFRGSSSIKAVLPVLIPELSYEDLEVQDGLTAQRLWTETIFLGKNQADKDKLLDDLLAYCKLDTLAMVEIFSKLNDIVFHR